MFDMIVGIIPSPLSDLLVLRDHIRERLLHDAVPSGREVRFERRRGMALDQEETVSAKERVVDVDDIDIVRELSCDLRQEVVEGADNLPGERQHGFDFRDRVLIRHEDLGVWQAATQLKENGP